MKEAKQIAILVGWIVIMVHNTYAHTKIPLNRYGIILAGGSGERLWPLSRQKKPKQLLSICYDKTLLHQSFDRVKALISDDNISIVTTKDYANQIRECLQNELVSLIIEPVARNTAPAILYACLALYDQDPNAVIVFLPADSFIPQEDNALFADYLEKAFQAAERHNVIVLLGVVPTTPATGYGYIEYDPAQLQEDAYIVKKFHEKPSYERACGYITNPTMLWNISVFCGKVSVFIEEFQQLAPDLYAQVVAYKNGMQNYDTIQSISVDYAVIEKSNRVSVIPVDFSWCDVGNVAVFLALKNAQHQLKEKTIEVNSTNNLIDVPDKLVALVGVDNLCIVQTADALLITKRDDAERVREVVSQLKQSSFKEYL